MVGEASGSSSTAATEEHGPAAALVPGVPLPAPALAPLSVYGTMSESVVTVVGLTLSREEKLFGTGFALLSEKKYTIIFACALLLNSLDNRNVRTTLTNSRCQSFGIYFHKNRNMVEADLLAATSESRFMLLLVKDDKPRQTAIPCPDDEPARQEVVRTLSAMTTGYVIHPGVVGSNKGVVITPSCQAKLSNHEDDEGTDHYMIVRCNYQDVLVRVETIDTRYRRSNGILAAPIFRKTGQLIGVIQCAGAWMDVKIGLHARFLQKEIYGLLNMPYKKLSNWEDVLKEVWTKVAEFIEEP